MLTNQLLVRGKINAVNFVVSYIALDPLNLGSELRQDTARLLRNALQGLCRQAACSRDVTLDYILLHFHPPFEFTDESSYSEVV
jgi:hypothetical protein